MKVAFSKITSQSKHFTLKKDSLVLECDISRKSHNIAFLSGVIRGEIALRCDLSGEEFNKHIDQELVLYISNGMWDTQSQSELMSFDVIEFFDGFIDIEYLLNSEIESIKSDYHIKE